MENEIVELKEMIKNHAILFLKEMREFYPFGIQLENDGVLRPVNFYDSEYPESETLINLLNDYFEKQITDKKVKAVGIGIDVFYTPANSNIKKSAIQLRIYHIEGISRTYNLDYSFLENGELFIEKESYE